MTNIKLHDLNVESDVYVTLRGPGIPCQMYKGMTSVITKMFTIERTYNLRGT